MEIAIESNVLGMVLAAQHVESIEALGDKLVNWNVLESLVTSIADKIDNQYLRLSRRYPKAERDMVFENSCLLVNDGISHLEYLRALREGDIGAILKVLDIWTVGFHASSATGQYAQELLSLALRLKHQWSTGLKNMLTDHWIVNPSGRPKKWQEADVVQESHNRIEKAIYGGKTYPKLSFLSEVVSANIPMLREHANQIERFYSTWTSVSHTEKDQSVDIQTLLQHFLHERVHILTNGRESDFEPLHT